MFAMMRDFGMVLGVVAKLRTFCNALVSRSLSSRFDKFITHLYLADAKYSYAPLYDADSDKEMQMESTSV